MHPLDCIEEHLVQHILSPSAQAQYRAGDVAGRELKPFVHQVRAISDRYIAHNAGTSLASPITSLETALSYALYYTPINAAKVLHLLSHSNITKSRISVLDLGCGPGTVGLALLAGLSQALDLTCIESSAEMRAAATQLLGSWPTSGKLPSLSIKQRLSELDSSARFDLVIAANILAELPEREAERYSLTLAQAVNPGGYLIILEPGQLSHTRRAMQVRDVLVREDPELTPQFPCLRADACPMLRESTSDWCHGALEWYQPRLHRQLDQLLGFNKHRIKFSGFIFQRGASLLPGVRVLTPPRKSARGTESLLCGDGVYGVVRISKRARSSATRAFEKASVFDRLLFDPPCLGHIADGCVVSETHLHDVHSRPATVAQQSE